MTEVTCVEGGDKGDMGDRGVRANRDDRANRDGQADQAKMGSILTHSLA